MVTTRENPPIILLPDQARAKLKAEAESIRKAFRQPKLREQALDHVIQHIRKAHPECFRV